MPNATIDIGSTPIHVALTDCSSNRLLFPLGFHPDPATDSSEVDSSDNEGFAVTDDNCKCYTGKSSNFELVRTVIDLKSKHKCHDSMDTPSDNPINELQKRFRPELFKISSRESNISPPSKECDFPPPDRMAELVDGYFGHLNAYFALLHRPTFEREVRSGLHLRDRGFGAVVLLVCAAGSAWAYGSLHAQPRQTPGWQWFDKVSSASFSLIARPRLYDVQACALMAAYVNATNSPQGSLPILSLGIRMAQDMGAHRKKMYSATPTIEQELWKRAFWALVAMDRLASFGMGRQCTIHDEDFDVDPVIECDDEYWSHPDPSQAFRQPQGKPSTVAFCNAFIRLSKIQAFALRTIFTINKSKLILGYVGPEWKQRIVAEIDSSMNKWLDTIPAHLRWDPNRENALFLNQSAILYANYYQLQIFVHRLFIPSPRRPLAHANLSLPSMTICVNAARACLRVIDVQHRRAMNNCSGAAASGVTIYAMTPLQMPLFTVGIMLLLHLWCGTRDARAVLSDIDVCLSISKDLAKTGNFAARKLEVALRLMSPIAQLPPSERSYPSSSSTLAKQGPQTIEELLTASLEHIDISMLAPGDFGSFAPGVPDSRSISNPLLSMTQRPGAMALSMPSSPSPPTGMDGSGSLAESESTGPISPEQIASHNRAAFNVFSGCDLWALQLNTIGSSFLPSTVPDQSPLGSIPTPAFTETSTVTNGGVSPDPVPTPNDLGVAGPPEFDFSFENMLMSEDLDFFNSLSSMFENIQNTSAPAAAAAAGAPQESQPQPQSTTAPGVTGAEAGQTCTLSELDLAVPSASVNSSPFDVPNVANQNPSLWQWISAPDGEL
ncbi:transcription factor [Ganoderma sinense ZZ0214-1]|uniref:Transcription factor n=1 Tax=Ganoderma sinense ZZ0214-1 TaxID=1077348 RepID=A0A2G8SJI3_9APHY|nr:transcription factor [Ganoderma sinense ZZ0214-1]